MEARCNLYNLPNQIYTLIHDDHKYIWNIDKLIKDSKDLHLIEIRIKDIKYDIEVNNIEYAINSNNNTPIIVIRYQDDSYELLDGNHRVNKYIQDGKQTIMAYCLLEKDADKYIMYKSET